MKVFQTVKSYFIVLFIRKWFRTNLSGTQFYSDSNSKIMNFKIYETLPVCNIEFSEIWLKNKEARVWEPHRKNLNQAFNQIIASDLLNKNSKQILVQAKNFENWESHLYRIVLFYKLIKYSFQIDPILIYPNYEVIDGYHRIVAYKLANENTVKCRIIN